MAHYKGRKGNLNMKLMELYDNIRLAEQLAEENYQQRNGVVDYKLPGVCNFYFTKYDKWSYKKVGEICLTTKLTRTVKGQMRYTYSIDNVRVAKRNIDHEFIRLGAIV